jgi:GNAT superfamily N-acetyltransferase
MAMASDRFVTRKARAEELPLFAEWAGAEGWNPGLGDTKCFFAQDPDGFFLGIEDGRPVACISVVNYGAEFAFLGFYIVRPDRRGRGYGIATWRAALDHAGTRTVGLDGVVAQQDSYRKSGFEPAHRTVRFGGTPALTGAIGPDIVVPDNSLTAGLSAYDAGCFPAARPAFLAAWLAASGHVVRAVVRDGEVRGFGVARPCREGIRIGPFFADGRDEAEALFEALCAGAGTAPVFIDVPEPNRAATALAEARGLLPCFETARMYTGPIRPVALDRVFGITTLELG